MKKNSLVTTGKGLSMSQAQSISNLCNQRCVEITNKFNAVNSCGKYIMHTSANGMTNEKLFTVHCNPLPDNTIELLDEKAMYHACQAYLMENIKAKADVLKELKKEVADISSIEIPDRPKQYSALAKMLTEVNEDYGWSQLTVAEINEYIEAEAYAAHIGQFIHENSILDKLRKELPLLPAIEWMEVKTGEKTPVYIQENHNSEYLHNIHETLATKHREYEKVVNYYKAKVKNITTVENARIARHNADVQSEADKLNRDLNAEYDIKYREASEKIREIQMNFEVKRQERIKEVSSLKINIDPRFQKVIDLFLKDLKEE